MKKILLSLTTAIITTLSVNAQADFGFETWVTSGSAQDPTGWASFNVLTQIGMQQTVFKETTAPYAGTSAAKIVTQVIPSLLTVPGYDTVGVLLTGKVVGTAITFGTSYTNRPANLNFAYKYEPVSLDSASVNVVLSKYNTTTKVRDVIASGVWRSADVMNAWTPGSITLNYSPSFDGNVVPDTITVIVSSSGFLTQKVGSTLYIDDINFSGYVSVNDIAGIKNNVTVFPSPARENVSFKSDVNASAVEIIDISGRLVGSFPMTNNRVTIATAKFESGMYIYNVLDNHNHAVGRGKFEVVK